MICAHLLYYTNIIIYVYIVSSINWTLLQGLTFKCDKRKDGDFESIYKQLAIFFEEI